MGLRLSLLMIALALGESTRLETRAFPAVSIADVGSGCSKVQLTARIVGPDDEHWYCPAVEWIKPDGTISMSESDCPPYAEREDFPRSWRLTLCAPAHPRGEAWTVVVRLSRNGKVIAQDEVRFLVKG